MTSRPRYIVARNAERWIVGGSLQLEAVYDDFGAVEYCYNQSN